MPSSFELANIGLNSFLNTSASVGQLMDAQRRRQQVKQQALLEQRQQQQSQQGISDISAILSGLSNPQTSQEPQQIDPFSSIVNRPGNVPSAATVLPQVGGLTGTALTESGQALPFQEIGANELIAPNTEAAQQAKIQLLDSVDKSFPVEETKSPGDVARVEDTDPLKFTRSIADAQLKMFPIIAKMSQTDPKFAAVIQKKVDAHLDSMKKIHIDPLAKFAEKAQALIQGGDIEGARRLTNLVTKNSPGAARVLNANAPDEELKTQIDSLAVFTAANDRTTEADVEVTKQRQIGSDKFDNASSLQSQKTTDATALQSQKTSDSSSLQSQKSGNAIELEKLRQVGTNRTAQSNENVASINNQPLTKSQKTATQKRLLTAEKNLDALDNIANNVDPKLFNAFNLVGNTVANAGERFGIPQSQNQKQFTQDLEKLITPVKQFFNTYRKEITGAAASVQELESLKQATINEELSATQFQARLNELLRQARSEIANSREALREGVNIAPEQTTPVSSGKTFTSPNGVSFSVK